MAEYTVVPQRFSFAGIAAWPPDTLQAGKLSYARNIRSYEEGVITVRSGLTARVTPSLGVAIHTLARLNDPTTYNGGVPAVRVIGSGGNVFRGIPSNLTPPLVDAGYSGNPLTTLSAQPPRSPRPYLYVADSTQFRKFTTDGNALPVGIAQPSAPSTEPTVVVEAQKLSPNDLITSTAWSLAGVGVASAPTDFNRINTTISQILYDNTATNVGYASIVPADPANITVGTLLTVGNPAGVFGVDWENALVTDITIPIASTTVESIIYDAGNTGLCTIQPAGSLGVGQLDAPPLLAYQERAFKEQGVPIAFPKGESGNLPEPNPLVTKRIRQVDFPVDCLVVLNAAETVRILSVAVGPDGTQSFRCSTATTIAAGQTITGLVSLRIFLTITFAPGQGLLRQAKHNTLTYPAPATDEFSRMTGGIQAAFAENLAQFADGTAVLPEDELHVAVRIDRLTEVVSVRVYIDIDAAMNDFLQNYYFHEWRASDIVAAIQATNAATVQPLIDARRTVVTNLQLELQQDAAGGFRGASAGLARVRQIREQGIGPAAYRAVTRQPGGDSAIAEQLALGNNQWIDLRVKVGTLTHVGTDPTRTLKDAKAFEILVAAQSPVPTVTPSPISVDYSDLQLYGGGGPDVGEVGDPYVYSYRYRSSETGAVSNPSPASRGGVIARRQNVDLTPTASADAQVDKIDWFRLGGALTQFTYLGTGPNTATAYTDRYMDSAIDGGEVIDYGNFQPWPLQDLPRTGTCDVAGTAVHRVSGDAFNTAWAPGSSIIINGRATTLYASPADGDLLHVVDSVGAGTGVAYSLAGATLLSQPLGRFWGPYQGFYFACGDQTNPGTLYWTRGNNIEAANDSNALLVTSPSEPLQNGFVYNTFPAVFSSEELYAIIADVSTPGFFRAIRTPCGRGLWTPWAFDIGPEGIYFLAADGIFITSGGSPAISITNEDLRAIFPHDGIAGESVNGIPVPDMTATNTLRLSYIAGILYFDYADINAVARTLLYDTVAKRWLLDDSALTAIRVRLEEPGAGVYDQIVGGENGQVYQYDSGVVSDAGTGIPWALHTRWTDGDAPRLVKQWGDVGLDYDPNGSVNGILATPIIEDGSIVLPATTVGTAVTGRDTTIIPLPVGGVLGRNLGLQLTGTVVDGDPGLPLLYWWEPTFIPKAEDINIRPTDWDNLGYQGAKFVQGIIIRANTYGQTQTLQIQKDGGTVALTIDINHDGEKTIAYPLAAAGWLPFVSELVRIVPTNLSVPWQLLDVRWVWEPAPELATQWETQFTSQEWSGYGTVAYMVFAYEATAPFILTFTYDDRQQVYEIPANGGNYSRYFFWFCPNKAKAVKYQWKTTAPGRIYKRDVSTAIQGWGVPGGRQLINPFGGPSRSSGAEI